MNNKISVAGSTPYSIYIGDKIYCAGELLATCQELGRKVVIITEPLLYDLHAAMIEILLKQYNLRVNIMLVPGGEENKTREMKAYVEDQLLSLGYGRDTILLALGGGVILDLVGFVAATYCRGIPVIYLPTTLLAMVDASIGGKTAVNTKHGKNLIGTFTQPHAVFIDVETLQTLPTREFNSGMAEVIKHAAIFDETEFLALEKNNIILKNFDVDKMTQMITKSCLIKKQIVEQDELEMGIRQLLNFGHTIGHALELATEHQLKHGEAIALGMWLESIVAVKLNYMNPQALTRIKNLLVKYNFVNSFDGDINVEKILEIMRFDKKVRDNKIHLVMLEDIGVPLIKAGKYSHSVEISQLKESLSGMNDWIKAIC